MLDQRSSADETAARLLNDPRYRDLVRRRGRFGLALTAVVLVVYFGFVLTIAFHKEWLARPIGDGVTSLGIPVGLAIILLSIALTGWYVHRANGEFDRLSAALRDDAA